MTQPEPHVIKLVVTVQMRCFSCGGLGPPVKTCCFAASSSESAKIALVEAARGDPSYPCPTCGKVFATEGWLRRHIGTHGVNR